MSFPYIMDQSIKTSNEWDHVLVMGYSLVLAYFNLTEERFSLVGTYMHIYF